MVDARVPLRFSARPSFRSVRPGDVVTLRGIVRDRSAMLFITMAFLGAAGVLVHMTGERWRLGRLSRESPGWAQAQGDVLDTRVVWSSSPRSGKSYWPLIHYRYSVGGTAFLSDRVSFRARYGRTETEDAAARYPPGSVVSVWYRPGDPSQSVLEPNTRGSDPLKAFLVPVTLAVSLLAIVCLTLLLLVSQPRR